MPDGAGGQGPVVESLSEQLISSLLVNSCRLVRVAEHGLQAQRILHRIAALVVVEVAIDSLTVAYPRGEGIGPAGQSLLIITAFVL